jgi:hypothetical protein
MNARPRGRLAAYARYQLNDYLVHRAALPALLVVVIAGVTVYAMSKNGPPGFWNSATGSQMAKSLFQQTMGLFLPLGAFMGINGLVAADRQHGHFRFLFSKPVNVPAFYAQAVAVHLVAFVAIAAALAWMLGVLTAPAPVLAAAESAALTFLLVGGLGLLLGSLVRFDGGVLVLVYLVSSIVQQIDAQQPGVLPAWASKLGQLLPPAFTLDQVRTHLFAGQAPAAADLWHVIGYGAAAGIAGLLVLRRAPLAR